MAAALYRFWRGQWSRIKTLLDEQRLELLAAQAVASTGGSERLFVPTLKAAGPQITLNWAGEEGALRAELGALLQEILGAARTKVADRYKQLGVSLAWDVWDTAAEQYAQQYKFTLIKDLTDSTRSQLGQMISRWIASDGDFEDLLGNVRKLMPVKPYPGLVDRARRVATTEVTRIYADSRQAGFKAAGLQRATWQTANDEIVCPRCGPLNNKDSDAGFKWQDPLTGETTGVPPRHVNCRCWITELTDEMQTLVGARTPVNPAEPMEAESVTAADQSVPNGAP